MHVFQILPSELLLLWLFYFCLQASVWCHMSYLQIWKCTLWHKGTVCKNLSNKAISAIKMCITSHDQVKGVVEGRLWLLPFHCHSQEKSCVDTCYCISQSAKYIKLVQEKQIMFPLWCHFQLVYFCWNSMCQMRSTLWWSVLFGIKAICVSCIKVYVTQV